MRSLYMCCHLDNMTGYGQQNCQFIAGFQKAGIQVSAFASGLADRPEPLPDYVRDILVPVPQPYPVFLVQPPNFRPESKVIDRVWFIVWESTRLDPRWVKNIDQSCAVITASDWNANCFSACGVEAPIYRVPLFTLPGYEYHPQIEKPKFVYGCSGHLNGQAGRKNIGAAVVAFEKAFPRTQDVELRIKVGEYDHVEMPDDRRIVVTKGHKSTEEMQRWYAGLDVFIHPSRSEGWGFQPLQAMATGRPVIACKYGGVAEYFDGNVGLELTYSYRPAQDMYQDHGHWAEPDVDSLVQNMLYAYSHRDEMVRLGLNGSERAKKYTLENTMQKLIPVLEKHGAII